MHQLKVESTSTVIFDYGKKWICHVKRMQIKNKAEIDCSRKQRTAVEDTVRQLRQEWVNTRYNSSLITSPFYIGYFQLSRYSDGLWAGWPGFDPGRGRDPSPYNIVQIGSGAHPAPYPMGIGGAFPGGKAAWAWSWPPTYILYRGKKWRSYTSTPPCVHDTALNCD
jgi:hypothetical protein